VVSDVRSCWDRNDKKAIHYTAKKAASIHVSCFPCRSICTIDKAKAEKSQYKLEDGDAGSQEVDVLIPAALEGQVTAKP
jgi:glutamate dehydrogenase/leucine dehydrogenase